MKRNPNGGFFPAPLLALAWLALAGCAVNLEPVALPADHPASVQAQEAPRTGTRRLIGSDELTRKTKDQLARREAADSQDGGMSHDMGAMDHSKMSGMEMKSPPSASPAPQLAAADWTCPMHPEIHTDKPGQCPKCGMTLVKKEGATK